MKINDCLICGDGRDTRFALVRWKTGQPEYTSGPRCRDRAACRERVEAAGETWDVADEIEAAAAREGIA